MLRIYQFNAVLMGTVDTWIDNHLDRIEAMGFNAIMFNPFFKNNGSLYAIMDYNYTDFSLLPEGNDNLSDAKKNNLIKSHIKMFIEEAQKRNIKVFLDIIFNHMAIDNKYIKSKPYMMKKDKDGNNIIATDLTIDGSLTEWTDNYWMNHQDDRTVEEYKNILKNIINDYEPDGFRLDTAFYIPSNRLKEYIEYMNSISKKKLSFIAEDYATKDTFNIDDYYEIINENIDYSSSSFYWSPNKDKWMIDQINWKNKYFKQYGFINNHDHTKVWQSKFSLKDNIIYQIMMSAMLDSYSMLGLTEFSEMNNMEYNILIKENYYEKVKDSTDFIDTIKSLNNILKNVPEFDSPYFIKKEIQNIDIKHDFIKTIQISRITKYNDEQEIQIINTHNSSLEIELTDLEIDTNEYDVLSIDNKISLIKPIILIRK